MNFETYKEKTSKLQKELDDLLIEFVESNNPYKIGDVVSDENYSILIQEILIDRCSGSSTKQPCAVYFGIILNKNGKPNKKGETRRIWQNNLKKQQNSKKKVLPLNII